MTRTSHGETDVPRPESEHTYDELASAKQRLLDAADPPRPPGSERDMAGQAAKLVQQHPFVLAGAAAVAGLIVARVPYARILLKAGMVWGAKVAVQRYIRNYTGGRTRGR